MNRAPARTLGASKPVASTSSTANSAIVVQFPQQRQLHLQANVSFRDIQAEEELARQRSNITVLNGNEIPWMIERRPRAESLDRVMVQQAEQSREGISGRFE